MLIDARVSYIALEQLAYRVEQDEATEGFGAVIRILDTFNRLMHNLTTNLFKFHKQFKRSELQAYHEGHRLALAQLFRVKTLDYTLKVPIPSGMKVTYLKAVTTLDTLYTTLAIETTTNTLLEYLKGLENSGVDHQFPTATTKMINRLTKEETETTLQGLFSADKTLDVPLDSVIHSFDELISVDQQILKYDAIFQSVGPICDKLKQIEALIDGVVTALEKRPNVDRDYVKALYQLVRVASVQFDMMGVLLHECQRVEHNFVLVLKTIIAKK